MTKRKIIDKQKVIAQYQLKEGDTGSCEVQIALLSSSISHLTNHLREHRKDFHTRRGLILQTNRRRKLLNYLRRTDLERYKKIIKALGLRR